MNPSVLNTTNQYGEKPYTLSSDINPVTDNQQIENEPSILAPAALPQISEPISGPGKCIIVP